MVKREQSSGQDGGASITPAQEILTPQPKEVLKEMLLESCPADVQVKISPAIKASLALPNANHDYDRRDSDCQEPEGSNRVPAIIESKPHVSETVPLVEVISEDQGEPSRVSADQEEVVLILEFAPPEVGEYDHREQEQGEE